MINISLTILRNIRCSSDLCPPIWPKSYGTDGMSESALFSDDRWRVCWPCTMNVQRMLLKRHIMSLVVVPWPRVTLHSYCKDTVTRLQRSRDEILVYRQLWYHSWWLWGVNVVGVCSPDLSFSEHLWNDLRCRVYRSHSLPHTSILGVCK